MPEPLVNVNATGRAQLEAWSAGRSVPVRLAMRSRIVLMLADGMGIKPTARELGVGPGTVRRWRDRYLKQGCKGLERDAPGRGRKPWITQEERQEILRKTLETKPAAATHWSLRKMAEVAGVSRHVVHQVWRANGLKPHGVRSFKLSNDPKFAEKLEDIVGLYLNPPERAIVLSLDEKSQVQALDRTQPGLPMKAGRCGTMTHDYDRRKSLWDKRNGTTTLFAALNTLDGSAITATMSRHRHQEWLKFLKLVEGQVPKDKAIHIICDNYATHKHPKVKAWLAKHPRIHVHFTPTSASWLNMVERLFRDITENRLRRGVFRSVPDLEQAIAEYMTQHNAHPKSFIWTATHHDILGKVARAKAVMRGSAI